MLAERGQYFADNLIPIFLDDKYIILNKLLMKYLSKCTSNRRQTVI